VLEWNLLRAVLAFGDPAAMSFKDLAPFTKRMAGRNEGPVSRRGGERKNRKHSASEDKD
jgi:hypothetical protein